MSYVPTVGALVKISPDIIPETTKDDELVGDLGYPGLFRHAIFEVTKIETDASRGEIAYCRLTNPEVFKTVIPGVKEVRYEGELVILQKDIVPANTKVTLEYVIEPGESKDAQIARLFKERNAMKERGLGKSTSQMKANWKEIQILRGEIEGKPMTQTKATIYLPKQKLRFDINPSELPDGSEESIKKFKQTLTNKLRGVRSQRRTTNKENKTLFGMVNVEKSGGSKSVYLKEGSLLKAYEEMMRTTLETDKKPSDAKATYVGIEIEMIFSGKYDALKKLLIEKKLHKYVCLKEDGSLRVCHNSGGYATKELTLICKTTEVEDVLKRLDQVLAHPLIDAYVNRSCGLHVHLDVRNRDAAMVFKNLVRVQNLLRGSQPVGRLANTHCRPNTTDELDPDKEVSGRQDRYLVVNGASYRKHSTIEVRIHEGTTNCEDIYNWVTFLNAIAEHKKVIPKNDVMFAEDLVGKFDIEIPLNAIDYIDRRIERFKSLTAV